MGHGLVGPAPVSDALSSIGDLASPWAYVAVALLATLESAAFVGLAVPGELGMLVGGYVASEGRASLGGMIGLATAGAILGDSIGYQIGRSFGHRIRHSRMGKRVGDERWERAETALRQRGGRAVFFGRFVGILRALIPALAGASGMRYRRFLLWNVLGAAIWGPGLVGLGYAAGGSYDKVAHWAGRAGLVLLVLFVLVAALLASGRWLARHPDEWVGWRDRQLDRAVIRQIVPFARRPMRFLGRRLRPGSALGLSLTIQLAVLGGAAWLFASLLQDVVGGDELSRIDVPVTRYVIEHRVGGLTAFLRALTHLGDVYFLVGLVLAVGIWVWRRSRTWVPLATMLATLGGAVVLYTVVRPLVGRPRPEFGPSVMEISGFAFPSGHATQAVAVYGVLAFLISKQLRSWSRAVTVWTAATLVALLVGFSRLYLGVNWISDVLAGFALGALWLVAVLATTGALRHRSRAPSAANASAAAVFEADWTSYLRRYHDERPGITEELLGPARDRAGRSPYDWLLEATPAGGLVVDIGCGSAPVGRRLAPGTPYLGVDRSAGELGRAQADGLTAGPAGLVRADLGALPVCSGGAVAVVASMALMAVPRLDAVLAEVARVLRPGGTLVATVPVREPADGDGSIDCFREMLSVLGQDGLAYPEPLDPSELHARFAGAGLDLVGDEPGRFIRTVTGPDCEMVARSFYAVGAGADAEATAAARLRDRLVGDKCDLGYPLRRLIARRRPTVG